MTNYQYLIIGGGMTAAVAVAGIREGRFNRRHRANQPGAERSVRSSSSLEGALEGTVLGHHLAQDKGQRGQGSSWSCRQRDCSHTETCRGQQRKRNRPIYAALSTLPALTATAPWDGRPISQHGEK